MSEDKSLVKDEKEMSFLDHLEELRWHIIRSMAAILIFGIVFFVLKTFIFENIVFAPKNASFITYQFFCSISEITCFSPPDFQLIVREMGEQFFVHIKVSFWLGLIFSFPYVFYEFWKFIRPGLYEEEVKASRGSVVICTLLFYLGILFGYFVISPFAITFLTSYQVGVDAINSPTLASYVNYMTMFTIPTGLIFELPVLMYFLAKVGLITPSILREYRKHAIVIILVLSAIITPPDMITQFLIGIPVFILYEISIVIAGKAQRKRKEDV